VKIRHHSPASTRKFACANVWKSHLSASGDSNPMTKIPAVIAMIVKETGAVWKDGRPNDARALTTRALPWGAAQSGHF